MRTSSPPGSAGLRSRGELLVFVGAALLASGLAGCQSSPDVPVEPTASDVTVVPLTYERLPDQRTWEEGTPYYMSSYVPAEALAAPPIGDWRLPEAKCAHPTYALLHLGDSEHLFMLDRENADDLFYSRVYFDANGNRDLTDDPPTGSEDDEADSSYFASQPIDFTRTVGAASVPSSLRISAYYRGNLEEGLDREFELDALMIYLEGNGYYSGEFEHEGQSYRLLLSDGNLDGRCGAGVTFPEYPGTDELYPAGDIFYLEKPGREEFDYDDLSTLGRLIQLPGGLHHVEVDLAASRMTLRPYTGALATVALPDDVSQVALVSESGEHYFEFRDVDGPVQVPPGRYRPVSYELRRKDPQGDLWSLAATGTRRVPFADAVAGKENRLALGEPFVSTVEVDPREYKRLSRSKEEEKRVSVSFSLTGSAGEVVDGLSHVLGNKTEIPLASRGNAPREPEYEITDADGEVVATGSFEYG